MELLPAGTYKVKITDWEDVNARTGTRQIRWRAVVIDGDYTNKPVLDFCAVTENSKWKLATFLACHFNVKNLVVDIDAPIFRNMLDKIKGRIMYWNIGQRTYEGRTSNQVNDYVANQDKLDIAPPELDVPDFAKAV